jgi:hypothetical protein
MPITTTCLARRWLIRNLHGRVAVVDGVRIAGLGGVFRGQVWTPPADWLYESAKEFTARCGRSNRWRDGLPRKHRSSIFPEDYFRLVSQRADILVTHEAPSTRIHMALTPLMNWRAA